jgi:glycosyltransferase involved in cell wall biosynthesis
VSGEVFVIVTARNEAARIEATLEALAGAFPAAPIWVADDGSTDATPAIARSAGAWVVRSERAGKGGAATSAARELPSIGREGESIFVFCDGDLAESAGRLAPLADAVRRGEADLAVAVFAARVGGGFGLAVGFARWAIRRRCGLRMRAPISGQRVLSARALREVLPFAPGFGMEVGMTIDAARAGCRVVALELDHSHRATGRTPAGFAHRARQLADVLRVYLSRGNARLRLPGARTDSSVPSRE